MVELHLVQTLRFSTLDNLLPSLVIDSSDSPYDYAIMTPDYKWHYYASTDTEGSRRWKKVNVVGEDVK